MLTAGWNIPPTLLFTGSNSLHTYAYLFSTVNVTYAAYSFYTGITVVKCMDGHDELNKWKLGNLEFFFFFIVGPSGYILYTDGEKIENFEGS